MNFFEHQDHARRQTKKLVILFGLAVLAIIVTVNGVLALLWLSSSSHTLNGSGAGLERLRSLPPGFFFWCSLLILFIIGAGTLFEMAKLKEGGDSVAQMVGGRLVLPSSSDLHERRLLNIVEEMALAAGIACPRVYILDQEQSINAFAAGYHQNEAVVAVTRGTLHRLTREELQGVVAHEFSHILNGDMRLNIKLIGLLFGIQMLALIGRQLIDLRFLGNTSWGERRDNRRSSNEAIILLLGVSLFVLGYLGIFFGRLIKAAVSRQREFLADASAVQFTRNPAGIGGALRKIGGLSRDKQSGSRINHPQAEALSHLFLGAARPQLLSGLFATHPPLEERLQRIFGRSMSFLEADELTEFVSEGNHSDAVASPLSAFNADLMKQPDLAATTNLRDLRFGREITAVASDAVTIPEQLLQAAREPQQACALVYALLLDTTQTKVHEAQCQLLTQADAKLAERSQQLFQLMQDEHLGLGLRMPLLDIATPALKLLNRSQREALLITVEQLILADRQFTQSEFVIQAVLDRRLGENAGRNVAIRYTKLSQLSPQVHLLTGLIARITSIKPMQARSSADLQAILNSLPELAWLELAPLEAMLAHPEKLPVPDFFAVRSALRQLNQLTPLLKPQLIRWLLAVAGPTTSPAVTDVMHAICAAMDSPVPEQFGAAVRLS